jgi:homocitrate synthase NifV
MKIMDVKIIDTTLRDGEQKAGLALTVAEKVSLAKLLDSLGIYQIEAGVPAMGGEEKLSIEKIAALNLQSRIAAWNRMNIKDISHSIDRGVDVIHISVPSSDRHINEKLQKDKNWVINELKKCIVFAKEKGFIVNVGMEDASRAQMDFLEVICETARTEGAEMARYADTVGILDPAKLFSHIAHLRQKVNIALGIHTHNDFGMAIANALSAVRAGAGFVDCTIGGIGERSGNCNFSSFIKVLKEVYQESSFDLAQIIETEKEIQRILNSPDG